MEQAKQDLEGIKTKLLEHIKKNYDEAKANEFISNINSMNDEEFIEFLKKQGLLGENGEAEQQCIFCQMISGNIPTTKIAENEKAICIFEINPISKGHAMILPKEHITSEDTLPQEAKDLANKISEELTSAFKPQRVDQTPGNVMGHQIINLIPVYSDESINSPRNEETPEGLAKLKEEFENSKPKIIEAPKAPEIIEEKPKEDSTEINESNTWLPKRFP